MRFSYGVLEPVIRAKFRANDKAIRCLVSRSPCRVVGDPGVAAARGPCRCHELTAFRNSDSVISRGEPKTKGNSRMNGPRCRRNRRRVSTIAQNARRTIPHPKVQVEAYPLYAR